MLIFNQMQLLASLLGFCIHSSLPFQEFTLNKYIWTMWCSGIILLCFSSKIFFFWTLFPPEDCVIYTQLIQLLKNSNFFIHAFIFRVFTTLLTFLLSSSGPVFLQIIFGMQQFGNKVSLNTRGQCCLKKSLHQWLKPDCEPYSLVVTQSCPCF